MLPCSISRLDFSILFQCLVLALPGRSGGGPAEFMHRPNRSFDLELLAFDLDNSSFRSTMSNLGAKGNS